MIGAVAFPSILGLAQTALFKPLRITCGSGWVSSVFGGASVCMAGCVASLAAIKMCSLVQKWDVGGGSGMHRSLPREHIVLFSTPELVLSTVSGLVLFRALGGRFYSILPSSMTKPGAFAREWIPARGPQRATSLEKDILQMIGRKHGCHTCGKRKTSQFVADHQPPSKIVNSNNNNASELILQRFYPQCSKCSGIQGGVVGSCKSNAKSVRTHAFSLRLYHLFLPVPIGITFLKSQQIFPQVRKEHSDTSTQTDIEPESPSPSLDSAKTSVILTDSNLVNFPLLVIWRRIVGFLDSFANPGDAFHVTLWMFAIVAAIGTI